MRRKWEEETKQRRGTERKGKRREEKAKMEEEREGGDK